MKMNAAQVGGRHQGSPCSLPPCRCTRHAVTVTVNTHLTVTVTEPLSGLSDVLELSDAPWLNRRRPGSLYSIIAYE